MEKPAPEIPKDRQVVAHGNRQNWRCLISNERLFARVALVGRSIVSNKRNASIHPLVIVLFALAAGVLASATAWAAKNPAAVRKNKPHFSHMAAGTQDAMKRTVKPSGNKPGIVKPSGGGVR